MVSKKNRQYFFCLLGFVYAIFHSRNFLSSFVKLGQFKRISVKDEFFAS